MILGELIKTYRTEHHMSMDDFAKKCGLSKAYISILERNINPVNGKSPIPSLETIKSVSGAMGVDFNDVIALLDGDQEVSLTPAAPIPPGFQPMPEMSAVPLVGSIACGTPILAEQNIEARIGVPALWQADFALTCHGNRTATSSASVNSRKSRTARSLPSASARRPPSSASTARATPSCSRPRTPPSPRWSTPATSSTRSPSRAA